jgi:hypothetical protein
MSLVGLYSLCKFYRPALIRHQGIICGVAFDRSSLRRIALYASLVAPRRLASNTLLVIRTVHNPLNSALIHKIDGGFGRGGILDLTSLKEERDYCEPTIQV